MKASLALQKRRAFFFASVAIGGSLAGCGNDTIESPPPAPSPSPSATPSPAPCPAAPFFAISVDVIDATTGQPVTNATGIAVRTDGTTVQLLADSGAAGRLTGGDGATQTGYWTVTVRAAGYRDWSIDGVGVPFTSTEDPCPATHRLRASLVR